MLATSQFAYTQTSFSTAVVNLLLARCEAANGVGDAVCKLAVPIAGEFQACCCPVAWLCINQVSSCDILQCLPEQLLPLGTLHGSHTWSHIGCSADHYMADADAWARQTSLCMDFTVLAKCSWV